jgi:hypothetical protein
VRTDFHARGEPVLHLVMAHERLSFHQVFRVPMIVLPYGIADEIAGRGKAVFSQERQRLSEGVGIAIIEREHNEITFRIATEQGQPFPGRHAAQPKTADCPQLPLELLLIDVQQVEPATVGTSPDIVVAENGNLRHGR